VPFSGAPFLLLSRPSAPYTPPSLGRVSCLPFDLCSQYFLTAESNNLYAAVVFNLHLNWLLMAFCRLDGSRTEETTERRERERERERESPRAARRRGEGGGRGRGNSQILKRPRERVAELLPGSMYRHRCFFAGYARPREERALSAQERGEE